MVATAIASCGAGVGAQSRLARVRRGRRNVALAKPATVRLGRLVAAVVALVTVVAATLAAVVAATGRSVIVGGRAAGFARGRGKVARRLAVVALVGAVVALFAAVVVLRALGLSVREFSAARKLTCCHPPPPPGPLGPRLYDICEALGRSVAELRR